jgi:predicted GNAT family N-acyltransferase
MRFCSECGEEFEKTKLAIESNDGLEKQEEVFKEHQFDSGGYKACVDLRYRVLREPLVLEWTPDELEADKNDRHFALWVESKVVACAINHRLDAGRVKLRQMAVDPAYQGKGVGRKFLTQLEETLWREGVKRIELHAREHAMGFYQSLGYHKIGSSFQEVGLAHYKMIKER